MSADSPLVAIRDLTKHYVGVAALTEASMNIDAGEVRALLGRNGAGKSTLIRMLSGVERPDSGAISIGGATIEPGSVRSAGELGVQTVHQELSLVPQLSVSENLFIGAWPRTGPRVDHGHMRTEAAAAMDRLGVDIDLDAPVGTLSLAAQQLVEIARAMRRNPRLLVLDEPTSALAAAEVQVVLDAVQRISAGGVAVIYVSHRLDEIRRVADSATIMRDGRIVDTVSVADTGTDEMVGMMLGETYSEAVRPTVRQVDRNVDPVLSVRGISLPPKVVDVSFDLYPGEVLGIAGLMGSGRTEVLRAIAGFDSFADGQILLDGVPVAPGLPAVMKRQGIGMTPENRKRDAIVPMLGVDENMVLSDFAKVRRGGAINPGRVRAVADGLIDRLRIATAASSTPIVNLSGGNQQKAVVGRWLHADARILLLDEPTRGVDVAAKTGIYALARELADKGKSVIFVSGELEELPLVCDRVLSISGGRVTAELVGEDITVDSVLSAAMAA